MNPRRRALGATIAATLVALALGATIVALYGWGAALLAAFLLATVVGLLGYAEHNADQAEAADRLEQWARAMAAEVTEAAARSYRAGFRDGAR